MSNSPLLAPLVSVIVSTYNHERSIVAAMRSVLGQQCGFPIEILVAEDWSTDATRQKLAELEREFPGRFIILNRGKNLGLSRNLEDAFRQCRGKYISILEGDDEWISPHKLERVSAVLEAHPDWTGCFHSCRVEHLEKSIADYNLPQDLQADHIELAQLLHRNIIPTYSVMTYRAGIVQEFPAWHRDFSAGDWGLNVLHAAQGPIGFLPDVMTAYRVHSSGLWSGKPIGDRWQEYFGMWTVFDQHFQGRYHDQIEASRREFLDEINREVGDLKRIEQRYHQLGLHRIASLLRSIKQFWQQLRTGTPPGK